MVQGLLRRPHARTIDARLENPVTSGSRGKSGNSLFSCDHEACVSGVWKYSGTHRNSPMKLCILNSSYRKETHEIWVKRRGFS
jgi:hypothetical protein